jgi:hypothetical protein
MSRDSCELCRELKHCPRYHVVAGQAVDHLVERLNCFQIWFLESSGSLDLLRICRRWPQAATGTDRRRPQGFSSFRPQKSTIGKAENWRSSCEIAILDFAEHVGHLLQRQAEFVVVNELRYKCDLPARQAGIKPDQQAVESAIYLLVVRAVRPHRMPARHARWAVAVRLGAGTLDRSATTASNHDYAAARSCDPARWKPLRSMMRFIGRGVRVTHCGEVTHLH